jgi:hypothetical protein
MTATESAYSGIGVRRVCCKSELESGAISGCVGADCRLSGLKSFHSVADKRDERIMVVFSKLKGNSDKSVPLVKA